MCTSIELLEDEKCVLLVKRVWCCKFHVHINKLNWLYTIKFNSHDKNIVWASDFILPNISVGVGETIEPLKELNKLVGRSVLLIKGDVVINSVYT